MKEKRISFGQGKGSIAHNNREFVADNVDVFRTPQNITFVCQPIGEAYDQLFGESTKRYNAKQKRNDRKVQGSYYEHLFGVKPCKTVRTATDKRKSFYEDVVQIGTKDDTGVGTPDAEIAVSCLREYMEGFQSRNPNFHVFNAVMHMDEATPHLHIDYIPVGHFDRGLDTRNAMAKALEEMGYGKGANAINRWRLAEWEVLHQICLAHGIEIAEPKKSRGYSYTTEEYGKHQDEIRRLNEEKAQALAERDEAVKERDELRTKLDSVSSELVAYKKAEEEKALFSREKLKKEAKRISREDELSRELKKAKAFISACGLSADYQQFRYNSTTRKNVLE